MVTRVFFRTGRRRSCGTDRTRRARARWTEAATRGTRRVRRNGAEARLWYPLGPEAAAAAGAASTMPGCSTSAPCTTVATTWWCFAWRRRRTRARCSRESAATTTVRTTTPSTAGFERGPTPRPATCLGTGVGKQKRANDPLADTFFSGGQ